MKANLLLVPVFYHLITSSTRGNRVLPQRTGWRCCAPVCLGHNEMWLSTFSVFQLMLHLLPCSKWKCSHQRVCMCGGDAFPRGPLGSRHWISVLPNKEAARGGCRFSPAWSALSFETNFVEHLGTKGSWGSFLPQFTYLFRNSGFFD